jgi:hypothetical protein
MRLYSDIDEARSRVIVTFAGEVTLGDIREMMSTCAKAGILHFQLLIDGRGTRVRLSTHDVTEFQRLVRELAQQSRLGQTAVLVSDALVMGAVTVLSALACGMCNVKGFYDRQKAEQWLGWQPKLEAAAVPASA